MKAYLRPPFPSGEKTPLTAPDLCVNAHCYHETPGLDGYSRMGGRKRLQCCGCAVVEWRDLTPHDELEKSKR